MPCYFRRMTDVFTEAGIKITPANKKKVDQLIHQIVDVEYKKCSQTWSRVKQLIGVNASRAEFIEKLKSRWAEVS